VSAIKAVEGRREKPGLSLWGQISRNTSVDSIEGVHEECGQGCASREGACCTPVVVKTSVLVGVEWHEIALYFIIEEYSNAKLHETLVYVCVVASPELRDPLLTRYFRE
jgi:hypothetical protein